MSKQEDTYPIDPTLRLQPGQEQLTPAQEAEARRFAAERIQAQLSTDPVDEAAAEALLRHVYQVAALAAPQRIHWVDGPLQLMAALTPQSVGAYVGSVIEGDYGVDIGEDVWGASGTASGTVFSTWSRTASGTVPESRSGSGS